MLKGSEYITDCCGLSLFRETSVRVYRVVFPMEAGAMYSLKLQNERFL